MNTVVTQKKWTLEAWIIAQELHEDGQPHLHAWLNLDRKVNIGDPRIFDVEGFHPNLQGCRSNKDVIKYVTKGGVWISSMTEEEIENLKNARENKKAMIG